jgi:hypothetical protein
MNPKNATLGLTAFVFAVGSAFASLKVTAPDYISVLYDGATIYECIQTLPCDNIQPILCTVTVRLKNNTTVSAQVYDLDTDEVNCAIPLYHSRASAGSHPTVGGTPIIAVH